MQDPIKQEFDLSQLKTLSDVMRVTKSASGDISHLKQPPFSTKEGSKTVWMVDKSTLTPTTRTSLSSKGIEVAYREQLESILYHDNSDPRLASGLSEVAFLYGRMKDYGTIQVKSSSFVRKLQSIVKVLNAFFRENEKDIDAISTMINGQVEQLTNTTKQ